MPGISQPGEFRISGEALHADPDAAAVRDRLEAEIEELRAEIEATYADESRPMTEREDETRDARGLILLYFADHAAAVRNDRAYKQILGRINEIERALRSLCGLIHMHEKERPGLQGQRERMGSELGKALKSRGAFLARSALREQLFDEIEQRRHLIGIHGKQGGAQPYIGLHGPKYAAFLVEETVLLSEAYLRLQGEELAARDARALARQLT